MPTAYEDSISNEYGFFRISPTLSDTYDLDSYYPLFDYSAIGDQELLAEYLSEGARGIDTLDWSAGDYAKQWP